MIGLKLQKDLANRVLHFQKGNEFIISAVKRRQAAFVKCLNAYNWSISAFMLDFGLSKKCNLRTLGMECFLKEVELMLLHHCGYDEDLCCRQSAKCPSDEYSRSVVTLFQIKQGHQFYRSEKTFGNSITSADVGGPASVFRPAYRAPPASRYRFVFDGTGYQPLDVNNETRVIGIEINRGLLLAASCGFDDRIPGVPTDQTSFIYGMLELVYTTTRWREENGENLGEKKRVEFNEELQRSPMPHDPHSFRQINLISGNHLTLAVRVLPLTLLLMVFCDFQQAAVL
ncbi:hypothetical protein MP228_002365 [Amoeboaphelidium protococcarum]|nr:hypothetical protein MP228_002365 [Amoeboaphelidium protococcarum]